MKMIAVPTRDGRVDDHFGHCAYYTVFTVDEKGEVVKSETMDSPEGCGCKSDVAERMEAMGITVMLAGNMGEGARRKLGEHGIGVIRGCAGKVEEVLGRYLRGELKDSGEGCGHHDCGEHEGTKGEVKFRVVRDF